MPNNILSAHIAFEALCLLWVHELRKRQIQNPLLKGRGLQHPTPVQFLGERAALTDGEQKNLPSIPTSRPKLPFGCRPPFLSSSSILPRTHPSNLDCSSYPNQPFIPCVCFGFVCSASGQYSENMLPSSPIFGKRIPIAL